MTRKSPSHLQRDLALIHPHAAAVDIGARFHVAAVSSRCDSELVRTFGTFTGDLQHLHEYGLPRASFQPQGEIATLRS